MNTRVAHWLSITFIGICYWLIIYLGPVRLASPAIQLLPLCLLLVAVVMLVYEALISSVGSDRARNRQLRLAQINSYPLWLSIVVLLFALQLVSVWGGQALQFNIIGGLLPYSDAGGYYAGALRLLETGEISTMSARRPLMTGFLATLLLFTQFSLQNTVVLIVGIAALACALAVREFKRTEHTALVLWFVALLFFFYNGFIGTLLTENLGFVFGLLAFLFLWRATTDNSIALYFVGLLFATLGQITRAGALFLLPALLLWGILVFTKSAPRRLGIFAGAGATIAVGFLVNTLFLEVTGGSVKASFSNFSDVLYGLSVGGAGWQQVAIDYPKLARIAEPSRSELIYTIAWTNIVRAPDVFLRVLWDNLYTYLIRDGGLNIVAGTKAWLVVQIPSLAGLILCVRQCSRPSRSLLLFSTAGILGSAPLVVEDGGLRVFAASAPFSAALAALGLRWLLRRGDPQQGNSIKQYAHSTRFVLIGGALLVIGCFAGALVSRIGDAAEDHPVLACPEGAQHFMVVRPKRSSIVLTADESRKYSYVPYWRISKFQHSLTVNELRWEELETAKLPVALVLSSGWILVPWHIIEQDPERIEICAHHEQGGLYKLQSFQLID